MDFALYRGKREQLTKKEERFQGIRERMSFLSRTNISQFLQGVKVLVTLMTMTLAQAQEMSTIKRTPANFVPDDDLIEVPIVLEKSFIDRVNDENRGHLDNSKKTVQSWQSIEEESKAYGLDDLWMYQTPNQTQRQNFIQRNYLRFLSKRVEQDTNQGVQNLWEEWTSDDEIDSIDQYEKHEGYLIKAKKERGVTNSLEQTKEVKVGRQKFRLDFQPRLEMGMVKIQLRSGLFNMKAWVGVNGNQELQLSRNFKATKTQLSANYYIDQGRALAAIDQNINRQWSLRLTHDKSVADFESLNETGISENNIFQLRFRIGF